MTREDFVFTIGFQGNTAIVDGRARREYGKLGTAELTEKGLYRAAFCSAVFSGDEEELKIFARSFAERAGMEELSVDRLKRLFGVYTVPDEVNRVVTI